MTGNSVQQDDAAVEVVAMQGPLFASLFSDSTGKSSLPDASRFKLMTHVRSFNTTGMANVADPGVYKLAAINSPRIGPSNLTAPQTAYAHLVSLHGVVDNSNVTRDATKPAVLVSLYNWSFTYLPSAALSAEKLLKALGDTVQPLRLPNASFSRVQNQINSVGPAPGAADSWVKNKMLSGYGLLRYRTPTGEPTIALQRGFLTPIKFDAFDFPPSDYGTDLAIVDEQSGLLDLTYQLAWELGKTMAVADRSFASALMRLRKAVHDRCLEDAKKKEADTAFIPASSAPTKVSTASGTITDRLKSQNSFKSQRWSTAALGVSQRETYAFTNPNVLNQYRSQLQTDGISDLAKALPASQSSEKPGPGLHAPVDVDTIYNEFNVPLSTDYATILKWLLVCDEHFCVYDSPIPGLLPEVQKHGRLDAFQAVYPKETGSQGVFTSKL